ncbi:hypothetical protein MKK75_01045 [Methylobacterium sp. J-030]|uniref:hypothetical protein n=1 Tax=Methylobacterium sp. J-030 TaxID=2836627 RepID=UPI001FBB891D|nr:hypothetical protein [Methylobacterium sp. J-030]MCJ2067402.1 hypothetical protein [Methylobacterium sp. J-030]
MKTSYALASLATFAEVQVAAYLDAEADGFRNTPEFYWLRNEARLAKAKRSAAAQKAAATRKANKVAIVQADALLAQVVATAKTSRSRKPRREVRANEEVAGA